MNKLGNSATHQVLNVALELAQERYPQARGYQGLMKKIALDEFGIGLTQDRKSYWANGIIKDEKKYMIFALTYGVEE